MTPIPGLRTGLLLAGLLLSGLALPAHGQEPAPVSPMPAAAAAGAPVEGAAGAPAKADAQEWRTWTSLIGPSKYAKEFKHYDYVNPDAPKGGTLNSVVVGSFDSFNPFIVRGTPAAGFATFGGGFLYETLMEQSSDESSTSHAMIAEALRYPADFSSVTFRLNPLARWHDGKPITPEDVIWSFTTLKALHPQWTTYYQNVVAAEKTGDGEVTFRFDQANNRELPNIMGDLTVLPKHWWEGTDAAGKKRDIGQPSLEVPLGSGAYRVASFRTGESIEWERVPDHWAENNPLRVGRYNFDRLRYVYFRDTNASWEAFKKGGLADFRLENSARRWSQEYNFPAAASGQVVRRIYKDPGVESMQAFVLNNRLEKFADPRVRRALTLAYNFEDMNRTLFFGLYKRIKSHFANSELAATGLPSEAELAYLEPLRGKVPDALFTQEFTLPDYSDPNAGRTYLREALGLLKEAGYEQRGGALVNASTGQPFTIEFLADDPTENRVLEPFALQLGRLGIRAEIRVVDPNQYVARMNDFDFEVVAMKYYPQALSPGNEQRDFWSSAAADVPGSRNYAGIKNPAVDQLIDKIVYAPNREALVAATRALDRVLLWNDYVVPQWYLGEFWLAHWSKLAMPERQPASSGIDTFSWWIVPAAGAAAPAVQ